MKPTTFTKISKMARGRFSDIEDAESIMTLAALEAEAKGYSDETDEGYILGAAWFAGKSAREKTGRYDAKSSFCIIDSTADANDESKWLVFPTSLERENPEEHLVRQEMIEEIMEVVEKYGQQAVQQVLMQYLGFPKKEIAQKLGVSAACISQRSSKIADGLRAYSTL